MISKEIFKKVRKLEIRTKGLVNNLFGGEYHSAFKGRGMVFSEVRGYQFGDDIRQIDWNVTARAGEPFIKVFEEEREQTLMLCVDISASGIFGSVSQQKKDLITELCAVMAFSAIKNNDKVGLILFTDKVEKVVKPRKGKTHVLRLIRDLYSIKPDGRGTDFTEALNLVNKTLNRRSIVVLMSDFYTNNEFEKVLKITNRKHDLVNLFIRDGFEFDLPNLGVIPFKDAESGVVKWIDTSNETLRKQYAVNQRKRLDVLQKTLSRSKIDSVVLSTNTSYIEPLMKFFQRRGSRN